MNAIVDKRGSLLHDIHLYDTEIWKALYEFQKDGATSAINRLLRHNGCIVADSVGLGKTWTALAVIEFFELRNERVLVLCPKRLEESWVRYTSWAAYRNNPFEKDRLSYAVHAHTDLNRYEGMAGTIDLADFDWGAFDLVVIDESHNFRDKGRDRTDETGGIAASNANQQGFVRIINRSIHAGTVRIYAIDDSGERFGPVELSLDAEAAVHLNSGDIERGNPSKGLSRGLGEGTGNWRLELTKNLDIQPLNDIRTSDGFLTSMHDVVRGEENRYHVPIFNPGSNRHQRSLLRLINPGDEEVEILITGRDDRSASEAREARFALPAGVARMLTAQQLEDDFGEGAGKWRLFVYAAKSIWVMSLLQSPGEHLSNLSTFAPTLEFEPPESTPPPKPEHLSVIPGIFGSKDIILNRFYSLGYSDRALTHIYRHTVDDFNNATKDFDRY